MKIPKLSGLLTASFVLICMFLCCPKAFSEVYVIAGDGDVVGEYLDGSRSNSSLSANKRLKYEVLTSKGYRFILVWANGDRNVNGTAFMSFAQVGPYWHGDSGISRGRYFESEDCSGQPYALTQYAGVVTSVVDVPSEPTPSLWYIPKHEELEVVTPASWRSANAPETCSDPNTVFGESFLMGRLLPNDPVVTGVVAKSFALPIRIERRREPRECIFNDRFEACGK